MTNVRRDRGAPFWVAALSVSGKSFVLGCEITSMDGYCIQRTLAISEAEELTQRKSITADRGLGVHVRPAWA